jgi:hypothetical protein
MRLPAIAAAAVIAALPLQAGAQTAATSGQTPEAAARFIDTVLGNGVTKVAWLDHGTQFSGADTVETMVTANCKTTLSHPKGAYERITLEIDWRTFVGSNSFFTAEVQDRWAARIMAKTEKETARDGETLETKQYIGVVVEPGTEAMKDRLIRAFEVYGKSCTPLQDSPF